MNIDNGDMFVDPRFADHRAPTSKGRAFLNGVFFGTVLGILVALDVFLVGMLLF